MQAPAGPKGGIKLSITSPVTAVTTDPDSPSPGLAWFERFEQNARWPVRQSWLAAATSRGAPDYFEDDLEVS
jgi:hypothetical protein